MTRAERDQWCEALESGRYKQTRCGEYRHEDCFCAVGVGYDALVGGWSPSGEPLNSIPGSLDNNDVIAMNDAGADFPTIAAWIRQNVPVED